MKNLLFATALFVLPFSIMGQVSLSADDFPEVNEKFYTDVIRLQPEEVPLGVVATSIQNFNLDLSGFTVSANDSDMFSPKNQVEGGDEISEADYGTRVLGGSSFYLSDGDSLNLVGLAPDLDLGFTVAFDFDSPMVFMQAPVELNDYNTDTTTASKNIIVTQADVKSSCTYSVNGYGTVTTPQKLTYNVIRLRRQLLFNAITTNLFTQEKDTIVDSIVTWEFYTPGTSTTVLRANVAVETDSNNMLDTVVYLTCLRDSISTSLNRKNTLEEKLLESQIIGNTFYANKELDGCPVKIYSLNGALVDEKRVYGNSFSTSTLPRGFYIFHFKTNQGIQPIRVYKR